VDRFVWVVAGPHEDDTEPCVLELARQHKDKVVIVGNRMLAQSAGDLGITSYHLDTVVWPSNSDGLSILVNEGFWAAFSGWVFQLQADEILNENDYDEFLKLPTLADNFKAASWRFRHYCGDFRHIHPFMYAAADFPDFKPQRIVRCCRYDSDWVNAGDAAQCLGTGDVYESSIVVHHCGKVHVGRAMEAAKKEFDFQTQLYTGVFDPDPRIVKAYKGGGIDYFTIGENIKEFSGPWPLWVKDYAKELGEEL
jgi:hypothetical protein